MQSGTNELSRLDQLGNLFNREKFVSLNEEMTFNEYLNLVYEKPTIIRTAHQRIYDMIVEKGSSEFKRYRKTYIHYNFFDDSDVPIFGLEDTLMELVKFIRGAAGGYGTEKRVLLLHGPVGSSKSTICRLLKKGMEKYSQTENGAWYTFKWVNLPTGKDGIFNSDENLSPMHEEPLKLIPAQIRNEVISQLNEIYHGQLSEDEKLKSYTLKCDGELDPRSKKFMKELLKRHDGNWAEVVRNHIRVQRMVYSEADRVGIATFQPKDEKNQDSTELTGDVNFAQLPHFGSDSDPRAFNFDGEFCAGNRGMVEFIEMLKLAQEFLYDLLGASQEQSIKPKKFSQIGVDLLLCGHSVHADTPIPHLYDGVLNVLPISKLENLDIGKLQVFSVNMETGEVELTRVKNIFSHEFQGEWIENKQDGDVVTTTPNHSIYKHGESGYEKFYPGEDFTSDIATVKLPANIVLNYPKTKSWEKFFNGE